MMITLFYVQLFISLLFSTNGVYAAPAIARRSSPSASGTIAQSANGTSTYHYSLSSPTSISVILPTQTSNNNDVAVPALNPGGTQQHAAPVDAPSQSGTVQAVPNTPSPGGSNTPPISPQGASGSAGKTDELVLGKINLEKVLTC